MSQAAPSAARDRRNSARRRPRHGAIRDPQWWLRIDGSEATGAQHQGQHVGASLNG
jgi:hypothetical protein